MNKIKTTLLMLALPWIFLWIIIVDGFSMFRDTGGHTSGLCSGFMIIGAIAAFFIGLIELAIIVAIGLLIFLL